MEGKSRRFLYKNCNITPSLFLIKSAEIRFLRGRMLDVAVRVCEDTQKDLRSSMGVSIGFCIILDLANLRPTFGQRKWMLGGKLSCTIRNV